ncbi:hypothetical protein U1Q18_007866, partial [Sarracenia purpurea var. burkii]
QDVTGYPLVSLGVTLPLQQVSWMLWRWSSSSSSLRASSGLPFPTAEDARM